MQRCRLFYVLIGAVCALIPSSLRAAQLSLDTDPEHGIRDTFYVPVRLDTQGECVNTVSLRIAYDPAKLSVHDIALGESIVTLWTVPPTIEREESGREKGSIALEGGMPGGYCGRIEGDPGQTNIIARLVVASASPALDVAPASTSMVIEPGAVVLRHDGSGLPVPLSVRGVDLTLVASTGTPANPWLSDVQADTIAPELFDITLVRGPSEGSNQHYIAFMTVDKQSGVDHYEVLETDPDRFGFLTWVPHEAHWVRATSPYVLRDQKLHSKILVRALDKRGNDRTVEYTPPMSPLAELSHPSLYVPIAVLVFILGSAALFVHHRRRRERQGETV